MGKKVKIKLEAETVYQHPLELASEYANSLRNAAISVVTHNRKIVRI